MLLSVSTRHPPATDLGYLLHKHPDRFQSFTMSFGAAHVFFPVANERKCTACLMLDIDPVEMARKNRRGRDATLSRYVNDRPWVASSFLSTAIAQVWGSALSGRCKERPELAKTPLLLTAELPTLPVRGAENWIRDLFEPLGYQVQTNRQALDEAFPEWGDSHYYQVALTNTVTLSQLLNHLYVLVPVFDNYKHYFIGRDELQKLLDKGAGWLASHPHREAIAKRYLRFQPSLFRQAVAQLTEDDIDNPGTTTVVGEPEEELETPIRLNDQRLDTVANVVRDSGAATVLDLGCGEGKLLQILLKDRRLQRIVGMDVSMRSLEIASRRLKLDRLPATDKDRLELIHGSLMYRDTRFAGFDAAVLVEVIEHLDPPRLRAMEQVVFEHARPKTVVVTTPNAEYNVTWESLPAGQFRHPDHRFEWSRSEFASWAQRIAQTHGYCVSFHSVGEEDDQVGSPTQMAVFDMHGEASS